jgi:hypothetical protein
VCDPANTKAQSLKAPKKSNIFSRGVGR